MQLDFLPLASERTLPDRDELAVEVSEQEPLLLIPRLSGWVGEGARYADRIHRIKTKSAGWSCWESSLQQRLLAAS